MSSNMFVFSGRFLVIQEQVISSDIEQQPPFGAKSIAALIEGEGLQNQSTHHII